MNISLHELQINADGPYVDQSDFSVTTRGIEAHFKDLENKLVERINKAELILGCVAWLTSDVILKALAKKQVSIVVQKEDFLRPDGSKKGFKTKLHALYGALSCDIGRCDLPGIASQLNMAQDPAIEPIRCVGNHNAAKHVAFPRSHHKFVVFCDVSRNEYENQVIPYAVWTGSFNFTQTAGRSFENAVYITHPKIVHAYANEYAQIFALSEPLNWKHNWCVPEWRVGT